MLVTVGSAIERLQTFADCRQTFKLRRLFCWERLRVERREMEVNYTIELLCFREFPRVELKMFRGILGYRRLVNDHSFFNPEIINDQVNV